MSSLLFKKMEDENHKITSEISYSDISIRWVKDLDTNMEDVYYKIEGLFDYKLIDDINDEDLCYIGTKMLSVKAASFLILWKIIPTIVKRNLRTVKSNDPDWDKEEEKFIDYIEEFHEEEPISLTNEKSQVPHYTFQKLFTTEMIYRIEKNKYKKEFFGNTKFDSVSSDVKNDVFQKCSILHKSIEDQIKNQRYEGKPLYLLIAMDRAISYYANKIYLGCWSSVIGYSNLISFN